MNSRIGLSNIIFITCSTFIVACYLLPQVQLFVRIQELALLTFVFYVVFCQKQLGFSPLCVLKWFIPFVLIYFMVSKSFSLKYGFFHPILLLWSCIFPVFMYKAIESRNNTVEKKTILICSLIIFIYVIVKTISMMQVDPTIARAMTSGLTDEDYVLQMKLLGIGGYGISYASGLLALSSLSVYLSSTSSKMKYGSLVSFLFFMYMVFNAQFTTLIILTVLCIGTMLFLNSKSKSEKVLWIFLTIIVVCLVPMIIQQLISLYGDSPVTWHLEELCNKLTGVGVVEESQRDVYRSQIISLMLESPFWGHNVDGQYAYLFTHSHSTILGYGLATGFVGGYFYIVTYIKSFRYAVSHYSATLMKMSFFPVVIFYVLLSFFNPTNSIEINFVFFLLVPLVYNCVIDSK